MPTNSQLTITTHDLLVFTHDSVVTTAHPIVIDHYDSVAVFILDIRLVQFRCIIASLFVSRFPFPCHGRFFDGGVAFLLPETACGEHSGRAFFDEGVAFSTHFLVKGLHF